ncbi:hypothetical protein JJB79_16260 [Pantoea eucrina]|uniref:Uncharacterized protein n=1 Tax=Pantoea eucrina TaxID=472693 RepID=A0ABS1Z927_9GAMM|nr:hypothetical protein [Pantoea eucrina]AIX52321.1 hypothetical protein PSNIH1_18905 [Pantoea sp. PSNIH1]MBM0748945.1 hypothetical protein [Pantoea eucrina]QNH53371.1 hypothetical protein HWI77_19390 [Acinetobacter venetianus]
MKKIALMGALMGSLTWLARRPPTVPVLQVRSLQLPDRPQLTAEEGIQRLATSVEEAQQHRERKRQAAQKRRQSAHKRKTKRGH